MNQGRYVLAAVDFSEGALRAVQEGRWLASRAGLELQVVHVAGPGGPWHADSQSGDWLHTASLSASAVVVRTGLPWVEIVRHAREISAAIIVLGSHGASGVQRMRLGSTASRVAMTASCPVLFVTYAREHMQDDPPESQSNLITEEHS